MDTPRHPQDSREANKSMRTPCPLNTLLALSLLPLALAKGGGPGPGNGNGNGNGGCENNYYGDPSCSSQAPVSTGIAATGASTAPSSTATGSGNVGTGTSTTVTGDTQCVSLMCMSAVVNGSEVQYVLQSTGSKSVGWMAIGFGQTMANSPMVIMWSNSDGSVTLSQRQASAEVMPTVVASPPRVATLSQSLTAASGSQPKFGFTIASNGQTKQNIIWAFGTTNPGSSAVNSPLTQHDPSGSGTLSLDLSKTTTTTGSADPASASSSPSTTGSSNGGTTTGSNLSAYLPYQKLIIAHASVASIAFLVFLPFGALLARYLRTFSPTWFRGHWIVQFGIGGPLAITGVALGIASVSSQGVKHLDDDHKKWGIGLLILYLVQCSLGGVIHFFKPSPSSRFSGRRPPQNYAHAVLGLAIIALGFAQVRTGYHTEWPKMTGRGVPNAVGIVWYIWLVVLPLAYAAGLFLLPRQFAQEKTSHLAGQARPLSPYADNVALNATDMRMRTA